MVGLVVWASVLATGLFGVPLAVAVLQDAGQEQRRELGRLAYSVAIGAAADVEDERRIDQWLIDELIEDFDGHGAVQVAVYDEAGGWLGGSRPGDGSPLVDAALEGEVGGGSEDDLLVVAVPVTHSDEVIGAVWAAAPSSAVLHDVIPLWAAMATLAALAVAAAWLVGRRQARRLAHPLEDLEGSARRLGDGDFSVRSRRSGIPEIDAVGAALDATAMRLEDLLARERAFSADASHQLRTPLAGMRLRLEAALDQAAVDPRPAIAATLVDADRLEVIIEELLTLARAGQSASAVPIDLGALLGELSPEWGARLALHGRDLEVRVDPSAPRARASTAAVRQVLGVLADNATTHGRGTVTIAVRDASGAVAIDVSDEGPGLRDATGAIFDGRADRHDGHGIGLHLARRLAEAEQGRLTVSQLAPPVFTLLLPAVREGATGVPAVGATTAPLD
jgi:signal transduction histidine kinase